MNNTYNHSERILPVYLSMIIFLKVSSKFWRMNQALNSTIHKTSISKI